MKSLGTVLVVIILIGSMSAAESPYSIANKYLRLWQSSDYSSMYDLLSRESKAYISRGKFIDEHHDFAGEFIINSFEITETIRTGQTARVYYRLFLTRIGSGELIRNSKSLGLIKYKKAWKILF